MKKPRLVPIALLLANSLMAQTKPHSPQAIRLIDKQLSLSGMFSDETTQNFIGLEAGDKIILNCFRLSKKGNASISIKDLNGENEIYRKNDFDTIRNESILVPAKGIYAVSLKTGSLLGKDVKLSLDRVPRSGADVGSKTAAKQQYDTSSVEVLNTTTKLYAKNSSQPNNTVMTINLPPNTTYWVYWIGAGKEALEKMKAFSTGCSTIGSLYPSDPMELYGRKFLSALPMANTNARISYHFMDTHNTAAFKSKQQYSFYMFKSSERITTEYSFIPNHQEDLNLGILNESSLAQDVQVRVVAFIVKPR
jgi:hypothetical protein